jgi:hypothetical protein
MNGQLFLRRTLKFLHTMGAIGLMGAMACLLVLLAFVPPPARLTEYALLRGAMGTIATWVFLPSFAMTLIAGLLAIAVNRVFHNAGWAWVKLVSGLAVFEGSFVGVIGPMQEEAEQSAKVLAGQADVATLAQSLGAEQGTLWLLMAVATANVVLGVWRPKLTRLPD